jgi:hypothetical protein
MQLEKQKDGSYLMVEWKLGKGQRNEKVIVGFGPRPKKVIPELPPQGALRRESTAVTPLTKREQLDALSFEWEVTGDKKVEREALALAIELELEKTRDLGDIIFGVYLK